MIDKETKQKLEGRIRELRQSLADIDKQIDQAMSQCPFITNLQNMRISLQGGILELEKQGDSHKEEKKGEKKEEK